MLPNTQYLLRPKGRDPAQVYTVYFEVDPMVYSLPRCQLMTGRVRAPLATPHNSDVAHIEWQ